MKWVRTAANQFLIYCMSILLSRLERTDRAKGQGEREIRDLWQSHTLVNCSYYFFSQDSNLSFFRSLILSPVSLSFHFNHATLTLSATILSPTTADYRETHKHTKQILLWLQTTGPKGEGERQPEGDFRQQQKGTWCSCQRIVTGIPAVEEGEMRC